MLPLLIAGIGAGISALGGLIGQALARGDMDRARQLRAQALAQYGEAADRQLKDIVETKVGRSNLFNEDPSLQGTEKSILGRLQEGDGGQLDMEGKQLVDQAESEAAAQNRGYSQALDSSMAARGMGNSGLDYLGQQMGIQGAASNLYHAGVSAAANREKAKLARMQMAAQLAGNIRNQNQEANRAQDAIDMYNASSADKTKMFNSGLRERVLANKYDAGRTAAGDYQGYANDTSAMAAGVGGAIGGSLTDIATSGYANDKSGNGDDSDPYNIKKAPKPLDY